MRNKNVLSLPLVPAFCAEGQISAAMGQPMIMSVVFLFLLSASTVFALVVPTAGEGFSLYTIVNNVWTTGVGWIICGMMVLHGFTTLATNWKIAIMWLLGGFGIGSLPAIIASAGLTL